MRTALSLLVLLAFISRAQADLTSPGDSYAPEDITASLHDAPAGPSLPELPSGSHVPPLDSFSRLPDESDSSTPGPGAPAWGADSPGSATLFLWAIGGFGATQLGRSARNIRLAFVPSWLHTGGPGTVGHATQLVLESHCLPAVRMVYFNCRKPILFAHPATKRLVHTLFHPQELIPRAPPA